MNKRKKMQDKHVLVYYKDEDRSKFIDKIKYPKTVICVGDNPHKDDIKMDSSYGFPGIFSTWILDNWDNLPEYLITCQSDPDAHVHKMHLAMDSTFTSDWGSLCFGRAIYTQYAFDWARILPMVEVANELGCNFINTHNVSKPIFYFFPGDHFFISRKKILEKGKDFFKKMLFLDNTENFMNFQKTIKFPPFFVSQINKFHPELKNLTYEEKYEKMLGQIPGRNYGYLGWVTEVLFFYLFCDDYVLDKINFAQAAIGNQLYFNTDFTHYKNTFRFYKFPYGQSFDITAINYKLLENDWFDQDCPNYKTWKEALKNNLLDEGRMQGFNAKELLEFYEYVGYKHISL